MTDPFSVTKRRFIPWPDNQALGMQMARSSLIGQRSLSNSEIEDRIEVLEKCEKSYGFVYVGERNWLSEINSSDVYINYDRWIEKQLNETVFESGLAFDSKESQWSAYTENMETFLLPPKDTENAILCDNVMLLILGYPLHPTTLMLSFEILHNLGYYLANSKNRFEDAYLDEIVVHGRNNRWELHLINEYTSLGAIEYRGQEIIGNE